MNSELVNKYRNTDTEELIKIAFIDKDDYQIEAVGMATKELLSRGITSESEIVLQKTKEKIKETKEKIKEIEIRDTASLETKSKVIFFVCGMFFVPFFICMFFIEFQKNKRGLRKTKESWKWLWFGLGAMVFIQTMLFFMLFLLFKL